MDERIIARFWLRVAKRSPEGCWPFTRADGTIAPGYGRIYSGHGESRSILLAHRLSYEIAFGPIPEGMHVRHRCDYPACVNPTHLVIGTHGDNMRDMAERGRAARNFGTASGRAVLTEEQVAEIRRRYVTHRQLATEFGVTVDAIRSALHGWKHI